VRILFWAIAALLFVAGRGGLATANGVNAAEARCLDR